MKKEKKMTEEEKLKILDSKGLINKKSTTIYFLRGGREKHIDSLINYKKFMALAWLERKSVNNFFLHTIRERVEKYEKETGTDLLEIDFSD